MNRSPQSIPSRRRKCCRCNVNGVNARCKSCACAKAGRACNDCLPSKHGCCHNCTTSITASSNRTANDFSSSQPLPQHTSSFPDSQQLPLSQPLPQLPPSSTPSSPSPGSLVAHPFDSQNQLHVSALIPEPKSPGQGPSFPSGSHFTLNEFQFQQSLAPSSQCGSQSSTCCKCYTSGARCTSCKCCREGHPCVNCYPGRSGKCANLQPSMPWTPSPQSPQSLTEEQDYKVTRPLSLNTPCNIAMTPHTPFPSLFAPLPCLSNGHSSPDSSILELTANDPLPTQSHVRDVLPEQNEVPSSSQHPHKKSCPVQGCQQLIAPTMWRQHMTLHAQGFFSGAVPGFWLQEQDLFVCPNCQQLVANSRHSSHLRKCTHATAAPPSLSPLGVQVADPSLFLLPTFESVCNLPGRTVRHIPLKDRLSFALVLSSALRSAVHDNSEDAWLTPPTAPLLAAPYLPPDFNIMAVLHSFPKDTACGPSGLRIQHLIEAAEVPLQFPICAVLREVVNLLISGKVPVHAARFLAGGNLVALEKNKPNPPPPPPPPDIQPIAVGEAIRRLVGKCLCSMTKAKAHDFLAPFQLGVACQGGAEKIIHGLRSCVDEHWQEVDFAVLKIDLLNAFNRVSRQAVLNACALHIPELLPWSQWCYGQHPALWHSLGTISSEIGVQQGDPLGPLLFCLVL